MSTPSALDPEMTFRAVAVVPPIVFPDAPTIRTPSDAPGTFAPPEAVRPMKLPSTWLPDAGLPEISRLRMRLPEITLQAPVQAPPGVVPVVPPTASFGPRMQTPAP